MRSDNNFDCAESDDSGCIDDNSSSSEFQIENAPRQRSNRQKGSDYTNRESHFSKLEENQHFSNNRSNYATRNDSREFQKATTITAVDLQKIVERVPTLNKNADLLLLERFMFSAKASYDLIKHTSLEPFFMSCLTLRLEGELFRQVTACQPAEFEEFIQSTLRMSTAIRPREVIEFEMTCPAQRSEESELEFARRIANLRTEAEFSARSKGKADQSDAIKTINRDYMKAIANGLRDPLGNNVRERNFTSFGELLRYLHDEAQRVESSRYFEKLRTSVRAPEENNSQESNLNPGKTNNKRKNDRAASWKLWQRPWRRQGSNNPNNFPAFPRPNLFEAG